MELFSKVRPREFEQLVGQAAAVKALCKMAGDNAVPHAIMFSGPSGTGKTTAARILRQKLNCGDGDFIEIDAATNRGIDDIRAIRERASLSAMFGDSRVWLIDEAHMLTREAQNALLKTLEEPPSHVYFFLATTDGRKVITTIRSRCEHLVFKAVTKKDIEQLIRRTCKEEKLKLFDEVIDKIADTCEGNARTAIRALEAAARHKDEQSQLAAVVVVDASPEVISLCKALINPRTRWQELASILKNLPEDPEGVRRAVLGYARAVMLNGNLLSRCAGIIACFADNYFDTGAAGLALSCYESTQLKS